MNAEELIRAGDVQGALDELQQKVRSRPDDPGNRIFLFQLLAILGQWQRAMTQLQVIGELDKNAWPMVHAYREAINCELHREAVFQGQSKPLVFGEPTQWMAVLIEAQQAFAREEYGAFAALNAQAFEEAPASAGRINGEGFQWLADADQRLGPVMEVIFNGHYYWVSMVNVRSLRAEEPSDLRDLVWLPAEITWRNGGQTMVLIPVRYPLLAGAGDAFLLSRKTSWQDRGDDVFEGIGQRMMVTDQSEMPLLQVRTIEFED